MWHCDFFFFFFFGVFTQPIKFNSMFLIYAKVFLKVGEEYFGYKYSKLLVL